MKEKNIIQELEKKYSECQWLKETLENIRLKDNNKTTEEDIKALYLAVAEKISKIDWEKNNENDCKSLVSCFMDLMNLQNSSPINKDLFNHESEEIYNYLIKFFENKTPKTLIGNIKELQDVPNASTIGPIALIALYCICFAVAIVLTIVLIICALCIAISTKDADNLGWSLYLLSGANDTADMGVNVAKEGGGLIGEIKNQYGQYKEATEKNKIMSKTKKFVNQIDEKIKTLQTENEFAPQSEKNAVVQSENQTNSQNPPAQSETNVVKAAQKQRFQQHVLNGRKQDEIIMTI